MGVRLGFYPSRRSAPFYDVDVFTELEMHRLGVEAVLKVLMCEAQGMFATPAVNISEASIAPLVLVLGAVRVSSLAISLYALA
jgi:hypothetical protein